MKQKCYLVNMNTHHGRIFHRISKWIFFWHAHLMWIEYVLTCPKMLPCQKNIQTLLIYANILTHQPYHNVHMEFSD
jgi:cytochrome c oxidase assembly factor CtaG